MSSTVDATASTFGQDARSANSVRSGSQTHTLAPWAAARLMIAVIIAVLPEPTAPTTKKCPSMLGLNVRVSPSVVTA